MDKGKKKHPKSGKMKKDHMIMKERSKVENLLKQSVSRGSHVLQE